MEVSEHTVCRSLTHVHCYKHVSARTGIWNKGKTWPALMSRVFVSSWMCAAYLGCTGPRDAEEHPHRPCCLLCNNVQAVVHNEVGTKALPRVEIISGGFNVVVDQC